MQIWRMHPDGSELQEQVITDETNRLVSSPLAGWQVDDIPFLSKKVTGHPPDKDVILNLMSLSDKSVKVVAKLFGGQGTNNVPSWSPDSTKVGVIRKL